MSGFLFSFDVTSSSPTSSSPAPSSPPLSSSTFPVTTAPPCPLYTPPPPTLSSTLYNYTPLPIPPLPNHPAPPLTLSHTLRTNVVSRTDATSDLVPGVYEGGMKLWECAIDVISYLNSHIGTKLLHEHLPPSPAPISILELGCGHALPSLYLHNLLTALAYHPTLTLSDYNLEVFPSTTIPNIVKLLPASAFPTIRCYSGDWFGLPPALHDIVIASETTYAVSACASTVALLVKHLGVSGIGIVATKRYYFGVGGGSEEFKELAEKAGLRIVDEIKVDTGTQNIRDLLIVKKVTT